MGTLAIKTWDETKNKRVSSSRLFKYDGAELWEYMQEKVWHHDWSTKEKRQSVMIITPNDFFDYQRVKAQVKDVLSFDWEDIDDLL
ncbi:post-transcriptional regulator [Vagococcus lutrae]|uniref:post-transcriptional regulator n=1 Tax=Vagococcus lutrae TaxID=81947 RepID=UPI00200DF4ED|nr:post-transcriptional regulator [Vagococcus lutrae]UQF12642.1 post-transcriptional regulator [Vagococcus lutrae]